jgi:2-keto-4-pentenoate hydratase/2-oxohepta-3-ene-1,7-dioic acid hydratase in catechol pathway
VAVGLNYHDHAAEAGLEVPDEPRIFLKAPSVVIGPDEAIVDPPETDQLDYEGELAIVIGTAGRRIDAEDALDHVAGFTVFNDVSARDIQYEAPHIDRGKGFDTFGPLGPNLTTPDDLDVDDLGLRTTVNGSVRQDSSTAELMFSIEDLIAYISSSMTLYPGDVIPTGTPPGVGVHSDPPALLEPGDEVEIAIDGIGTLTNPVRAETV